MKGHEVRFRGQRQSAFTRVECLCCLGAVLLLFCVALPGFGNTRSRSQLATCVDNLRLIGQAVLVFGADHDNRPPWLTPENEGGTRRPLKSGRASYEFQYLSNQLVTPKILVCPSDAVRVVKMADSWGLSADGGYQFPSYRDNATSYLIGLHGFFSEPNALLSGDRNIRVDSSSATCGIGVHNTFAVRRSEFSQVAWTNLIHGLQGNIVVADGRVIQVPNSGLKTYLKPLIPEDNGDLHLLIP